MDQMLAMMNEMRKMQQGMQMGFQQVHQNHEGLQREMGNIQERLTQTEDAMRTKLHGGASSIASEPAHDGNVTEEEEGYQTQMRITWRKREGQGPYDQQTYPA